MGAYEYSIPTKDEFESLPPALRRKFFSNVERLRMRLAQNDHNGPDYPSALASGVPRRLHFQNLRRRPARPLNRNRRLDKPLSYESYASSPSSSSSSGLSQPARTPGLQHSAYRSARANSQYFHSLPSKVQQTFFSLEEQAQLRQAHRESAIFDAADQAFYRFEKRNTEKQACQSSESLPSLAPDTLISQSSTLYLESSGSDWDTESESDDDMDDSLYDSFRWLDDDGNLDLTLDEYRSHAAGHTAPKQQPRRKPSFRRTMSFNPPNHARRATSSAPIPVIPTSSQSSTVPSSLAHIISGRHSTSRPSSGQQRPIMHVPRSSTSSIDPTAQYYQDPEARLKLRVYLASPQKFDEAVEFGFPALDDKKDGDARPERSTKRPLPLKPQKVTGTFFEDEDGSVHGDRNDKAYRKSSRFSTAMKGPQSLPSPTSANTKRQSSSGARRLPANREMTLKMTLTRPDLRTDSPSASPTSAEDPLRLAELARVENGPQIWNADSDQQNVMKKMWRKLRKQKC